MSLIDLYKGLASLSPEQRALFARKLAESGLGAQTREIAPRPPGSDPVPASLAQQRLWLVDQVDPGDPFYNLPLIAFDIRGPLDVAALVRTLDEVERRHEALRTTFADLDGQPVQIVAPPGARRTVRLPVVDLSALPEPRRLPTMEALAYAESRSPFDLARGPLWRTHLLRVAKERSLLVIIKHHIVSDAWSIAVFYREMTALYAAFVKGEPSPLAELTIQYPDFALWQRERLAGGWLEEELAFWRGQLAGAPETIELPFDHPRPPTRTYRGRRQAPDLPADLPDGLHALATQTGSSLFILLLAAYDALLHRYSGQDEIVLGSPVAGRNEIETEALIGFFVNTVVYRIRIGGNPTFRELLRRVRDVVLDVYEHQEMPFAKLVEELKPKRNTAHGTLFQAMFSLQNVRTPDLEFAGLKVQQIFLDNQTAQTDLIAFGGTREGRLSVIQVEYNTDLFDDVTITRFLIHLVNLLGGAVDDPDRPLFEMPILTAAERQQLAEWNAEVREMAVTTHASERLER
ncbi:MAG TPA: condensation domain-containing protein, partial [Thermoanaerobaculia bacterium]